MRTSLLICTLFTSGILLFAASARAENSSPVYALGLGFDITRGTFGSTTTNTFVSTPVIIDWFPTTRLDFELTVPMYYQQLTHNGNASSGTSSAKVTARGPLGGAGSTMAGTGSTIGGTGTASTVSSSSGTGGGGGVLGGDYGMGDVTLTSGYALLEDGDSSLLLRPTLYVKFPTADTDKGFGTGKLDFGAGLAVSKWLGSWQPFAEGRYIVQGASHADTGALNFLTVDAGVTYGWTERLATSVYTRTGSALFDGMSAPLEARLKMSWRFGKKTYTDAYVLKGFGDGSPDYGGGVAVFAEF
ncbi:MAG: hypothetical protein PHI31_08270 [Desulfuromonadaceae bacterium]|nr:hypothetical protein [Desulfuromonadaceae bacterium]